MNSRVNVLYTSIDKQSTVEWFSQTFKSYRLHKVQEHHKNRIKKKPNNNKLINKKLALQKCQISMISCD